MKNLNFFLALVILSIPHVSVSANSCNAASEGAGARISTQLATQLAHEVYTAQEAYVAPVSFLDEVFAFDFGLDEAFLRAKEEYEAIVIDQAFLERYESIDDIRDQLPPALNLRQKLNFIGKHYDKALTDIGKKKSLGVALSMLSIPAEPTFAAVIANDPVSQEFKSALYHGVKEWFASEGYSVTSWSNGFDQHIANAKRRRL